MTSRSKIILLSASALALCVIATAAISGGRPWIPSNGASAAVLMGIILAAVLSVVFVAVARSRKRPDEKVLGSDYFPVFEEIRDILMASPLPLGRKKNVIDDVLAMLLDAQASGRTVASAIGDGGAFAREIIRACASRPRRFLLHLTDGAMAFIGLSLFIHTLLWLENPAAGFYGQAVDLSMLLLCGLIVFAVLPATRLLLAAKSLWAYLVPLFSGIAYIGVLMLLRLCCGDTKSGRPF